MEHDLNFANPEGDFRQALLQAGAEVKPRSPPKSPPLLPSATKRSDKEPREKIKKDQKIIKRKDEHSEKDDRKRKKDQKRSKSDREPKTEKTEKSKKDKVLCNLGLCNRLKASLYLVN